MVKYTTTIWDQDQSITDCSIGIGGHNGVFTVTVTVAVTIIAIIIVIVIVIVIIF